MIAFSTPAGAPRWKRWAVYSPLARIVIFAAVLAALMFLGRLLLAQIGWLGKEAPVPQRHVAAFTLQVVPALAAYLFLVCVVERRRPRELALRRILPDGVAGAAAGVLLLSMVVGALWLAGSYRITGTHPDAPWAVQLMLGGLGAAVIEETITRGILFRITEEGLGTWAALLVSALVFGFGHFANQGATLWSSVAITIEAGLLFGLLFHVTRSLPLCIGLHMGWNFAQGTVWGIPVSGQRDVGWLASERGGPDWLSGGVFGAEASVVAVVLCSTVTLALLAVALRRRSIVPPWFARRPAPAPWPQAADNRMAQAPSTC